MLIKLYIFHIFIVVTITVMLSSLNPHHYLNTTWRQPIRNSTSIMLHESFDLIYAQKPPSHYGPTTERPSMDFLETSMNIRVIFLATCKTDPSKTCFGLYEHAYWQKIIHKRIHYWAVYRFRQSCRTWTLRARLPTKNHTDVRLQKNSLSNCIQISPISPHF